MSQAGSSAPSTGSRQNGESHGASPFVEIARADWAALAATTPLPLRETEVVQLRGLGDPLDMREVQEVYLPLSRLLMLYATGKRHLHASTSAFLGERARSTPFVIGVAGSVAVGKSTIARLLRELLARWEDTPRVELLRGGTALLELAPFLFPLAWSAEPLAAALTLVARAEALILDLRGNGGGDPDTVAFVCSYLLDERTHLNTLHARVGDRYDQSWTLPHVPGARFGGTKPVHVLTGPRTFSAAEELAYDLQQLGRATVVGEPTRGGAHPREGWTVHPNLEATIPVARAINPVSGTNWEGTGVLPDVPCPAPDALDRALALIDG